MSFEHDAKSERRSVFDTALGLFIRFAFPNSKREAATQPTAIRAKMPGGASESSQVGLESDYRR